MSGNKSRGRKVGDKGEKGLDFIIRANNGGRRWRLRRGEKERGEKWG